MNFGEIVSGHSQRWRLVEKLGEGDAGEVYRVESLLGRESAIIKRPKREGLTNEILRQASQIRTEGQILRALKVYLPDSVGGSVKVPEVLDSSPKEAAFGEQFFLVIQEAQGIDLQFLSKAVHFGQLPKDSVKGITEGDRLFIQRATVRQKIPELLLLRSLDGLIRLLDKIHFLEVSVENELQYGILWNDIKPDHIFWNPGSSQFTIIDWGNGRFLNEDGTSEDRQSSRLDDYEQFLQEMGKFLLEASPDLHQALNWPEDIPHANVFSEGVKPLAARIQALLDQQLESLRELRRKESDLLHISHPARNNMESLNAVQGLILDVGELPDYQSALHFHTRLAERLAESSDLNTFLEICELASQLPASQTEKWDLLIKVGKAAEGLPEDQAEKYSKALALAAEDRWEESLWALLTTVPGESGLPAWWEEVSTGMRRIRLQVSADTLTPYVTLSRLYYTLQAAVRNGGNNHSHSDSGLNKEGLLRLFEEEVIKKWKQAEPDPPNSGIEYNDIDSLLESIDQVLPGTRTSLEQTFAQPKAHVEMIMDAWSYKDFDLARRGLRQLLLWDPHRRRLILADQAMQQVKHWLLRIRRGAESNESTQDYLIQMELSGRELRNQVGPAKWLNLILSALKKLRNGERPADLLMAHPELLNEMPWLNEARSRETISLPRKRSLVLEREAPVSTINYPVRGVREGWLGNEKDLYIDQPLDLWTPEAQGSSARVFNGVLKNEVDQDSSIAVKIMRPNRQDYASPLFREEASILTLLRDVPGVTRLLEVGFLMPEEAEFLNEGKNKPLLEKPTGMLQRYGVDQVQSFLSVMDAKIGEGWLPYLALEKRRHTDNLMAYCDAGLTHGRFLPLRESLFLAIQICDIIQTAHDRNVAYRDHKILHYYWDPETAGVWTIDWNIAKRYPQGLSAAEKQLDLVQFGARALHHILTGRPAPGALPLGPNRPEEIEQAAHSYTTQWTYDDERLPNRVKEILETVLSQGYNEFRDLRRDLLHVYEQMGENVPDSHATS